MMSKFRHNLRRFIAKKDGATAVEFAFIAPVIGMIIFGALEMGMFFMGTHQVQAATEDTSRRVRMESVRTQADVLAILKEEMGTPFSGEYTPDVQIVSVHGEDFADIRVQYTYTMKIPFLDKYPFNTEAGTRVLLR